MSSPYTRTLLQDVAKEAGVSTASVSRVLNRAPHVSERVRQKVEDAVQRLGYVPDGTARALASRKIGAIGALIPTLDNPIFGAMANSLEQRLKAHDCRLLISTYRYQLTDELEAIKALIQHGVDGLVLIGSDHLSSALQILEQRDLPYITCWHSNTSSAPCVGFDNHAPAAELMNHLISLGHRNIGVISAPTETNDRARDRLEGLKSAAHTAGIVIPACNIVTVDYGIAEGALACQQLLSLPERPSAIACGNDTLAFGAMLVLQREGLRIPDDISITGFDDLPQASFMNPSLTTVAVPASEMGRCVADQLMARINGNSPPCSQTLTSELLIRNSTGPAPHLLPLSSR